MKILHVVPGLSEGGNGIAVAAKLIAEGQLKSGAEVEVVDTRDFVQSNNRTIRTIEQYSEVWVHSMWLPMTLKACWKVLRNVRMFECSECSNVRPKLVRMTHANLDPVRYCYHGWKKRLVAPIERWLFRWTDRVVVTCEEEKKWCQMWGLKNEFEILDLKKFFDLGADGSRSRTKDGSLHVLYLGRRHPLKGVEFLEKAVAKLNGEAVSRPLRKEEGSSLVRSGRETASPLIDLRIVSDHFGEELERDWAWCDVLVLPTLSENFGLVVAEALERGKRVITTDGAPAWEPPEERSRSEGLGLQWWDRIIYLKGFRDGTDEERVRLLKEALEELRPRS